MGSLKQGNVRVSVGIGQPAEICNLGLYLDFGLGCRWGRARSLQWEGYSSTVSDSDSESVIPRTSRASSSAAGAT
jgi:hypothetical protein